MLPLNELPTRYIDNGYWFRYEEHPTDCTVIIGGPTGQVTLLIESDEWIEWEIAEETGRDAMLSLARRLLEGGS